MKVQHLRYFTAVVDCGSVTSAARRLNVSQPTLSHGIKALEQELGEALFDRVGGRRRVLPTTKALAFYERAREILQQCDSASQEFRSGVARPSIRRLGVMRTLAADMVSGVITWLARDRSDQEWQTREGAPEELARWLRRGRIDMAWTTINEKTRNARVLWREPFVALVPEGHRFAGSRRKITLRDLDKESLVLRASCELKIGRLRDAGINLRIAARVERDDLALRLVAQGLGITIAPRSLATEKVVAVQIVDLRLERAIGLRWQPDLPREIVRTVLDGVSSLGLKRN